jgi:Xaa-Pro dipeptidase
VTGVAGRATLHDPDVVDGIRGALAAEDLDGWLLYDFHGLNPVAQRLLGLGKTTRRGFVLVPREGAPVALIHAIEASAWRSWPFERRVYSGWRELESELRALLAEFRRVAMEVSPGGAVPTLDLVPAGMAGFLLELGLEIASSGDLVSRFHSVWTKAQRDDHGRAAEVVADVARRAFQRAADAVRAGTPTTEGALSDWIRDELGAAGLTQEVDCIVAVGAGAADPHYAPDGVGSRDRARHAPAHRPLGRLRGVGAGRPDLDGLPRPRGGRPHRRGVAGRAGRPGRGGRLPEGAPRRR